MCNAAKSAKSKSAREPTQQPTRWPSTRPPTAHPTLRPTSFPTRQPTTKAPTPYPSHMPTTNQPTSEQTSSSAASTTRQYVTTPSSVQTYDAAQSTQLPSARAGGGSAVEFLDIPSTIPVHAPYLIQLKYITETIETHRFVRIEVRKTEVAGVLVESIDVPISSPNGEVEAVFGMNPSISLVDGYVMGDEPFVQRLFFGGGTRVL